MPPLTLAEVTSMFPRWFLPAAAFLFGLLWGSFLNVVIYRVPRDMSVVRPASHCPACGKPVAPYDNVPLFSFLILRGRARCCGAKMSPRYLVVEFIGGLLSLAVFQAIVLALPNEAPAHRALAIYAADFVLCLGLVAAAFIDAEHMFLPDRVTLGGLVLGIATASLRDLPFVDALIGAAVGFTAVWLPFVFLYKGLLGRTGMGMGDAKLLALAGAWFGWQGAVFVLFAGALQGTIYAGIAWVFGIEHKLPKAVQEDIDELKKDAAAGNEEAKKLLEEDPLTENEDDAFIVAFFRKIFGAPAPAAPPPSEAAPEAPPPSEHPSEEDVEVPRARMPFGPFLILSILELLFVGGMIFDRLEPVFGPR